MSAEIIEFHFLLYYQDKDHAVLLLDCQIGFSLVSLENIPNLWKQRDCSEASLSFYLFILVLHVLSIYCNLQFL